MSPFYGLWGVVHKFSSVGGPDAESTLDWTCRLHPVFSELNIYWFPVGAPMIFITCTPPVK